MKIHAKAIELQPLADEPHALGAAFDVPEGSANVSASTSTVNGLYLVVHWAELSPSERADMQMAALRSRGGGLA